MYTIEFYVPGTSQDNKVITNTELRARARGVAKVLSDMLGGATIIKANGAYVSEHYGLIIEPVMLVYSYSQEPLTDSQLARLHSYARFKCARWYQESILIAIMENSPDSKLLFVTV